MSETLGVDLLRSERASSAESPDGTGDEGSKTAAAEAAAVEATDELGAALAAVHHAAHENGSEAHHAGGDANVGEHPGEPEDELVVDGLERRFRVLHADELSGLGLVEGDGLGVVEGVDAQVHPEGDLGREAGA